MDQKSYEKSVWDRVAQVGLAPNLLRLTKVINRSAARVRFVQVDKRILLQDPCVYCGGKATGLDHIVAQSQGGENGWYNRAPACKKCDSRKSNKNLLTFLMERKQ